jgi:hypothetical protein
METRTAVIWFRRASLKIKPLDSACGYRIRTSQRRDANTFRPGGERLLEPLRRR